MKKNPNRSLVFWSFFFYFFSHQYHPKALSRECEIHFLFGKPKKDSFRVPFLFFFWKGSYEGGGRTPTQMHHIQTVHSVKRSEVFL